MLDQVMFTVTEEEVLEQKENRKLWNPWVSHDVESLDKEDRDAGIARYSSTKELLLEYNEANCRRVCSA